MYQVCQSSKTKLSKQADKTAIHMQAMHEF